MSPLVHLQFALSVATDRRDDSAFEPLCDVLRRMAQAPETPPRLRRALHQALAAANVPEERP